MKANYKIIEYWAKNMPIYELDSSVMTTEEKYIVIDKKSYDGKEKFDFCFPVRKRNGGFIRHKFNEDDEIQAMYVW